VQHTIYITATYCFHHCNILFKSLQHTPYITAAYTLNQCREHAGVELQQKTLRTDCNTSLPSLKHTRTSLQHTAYITATYLVGVESQRKALCVAFLIPLTSMQHISPKAATRPCHHCNIQRTPVHHCNVPLISKRYTTY